MLSTTATASDASEERKGDNAASERGTGLSGYSLLCDPIAGHLSIFRNMKGVLGAVNVTVHSRVRDIEAEVNKKVRNIKINDDW